MAVEQVYEYPLDYELEVAAAEVQDLAFWRSLIRRERPRRLLEVGCGTGRLTIPLARDGVIAGYSVTGLDLEPAMLARAREWAAKEPAAVQNALTLLGGDVSDLDLYEPFDLVMMPYGTAHHLTELDQQIAAWQVVRRHLRPHGLFAVDLVAPDLARLAAGLDGTPREQDLEADDGLGHHLRRTCATAYDAATQRATVSWIYDVTDPDGRHHGYPSDFAMHVYFPRELTLLFQLTGFTLERLVGSYDGESYCNHSRQLIALARAM